MAEHAGSPAFGRTSVPAGGHAADAGLQHHEDHDSFRAQLRERLIGWGSMDRRLRLVVGAAIAQLVAAAIMVALRNAHLPTVIGDVTGDEESAIPVATFVIAVTFLTVAWGFLLAGALHAHWSLRVITIGLFGWSFWVERDIVTDTTAGIVAAAALMGVIVLTAITSMVRDRGPDAPGRQRLLAPRVVLILPVVAGLYLTAWMSSRSADNVENFTTAVADQLYNLEYVLIPLLVLAGADFADWGYLVGTRASAVVTRVRSAWPLLAATAVVAAVMLFDARRVLDIDFGRELGLGVGLVVAVAVLAVLARPRAAEGHAHLPFMALAAVVVLDATMGFLIESRVGGSDDSISDHIYAITALVWAGLAVVCLLALAVRRGRGSAMLTAVATFVTLVGVCDVLFGLASIAAVFPGLHISADDSPLDIDGVRAIVAIAALVFVVALVGLRRVRGNGRLLGTVLGLLVGVQVLAWVDLLFNHTATVSERLTGGFSIAAGIVLIVALLLELLASGEAITNRNDRLLPRQSRVLLYLGYIVLVAAAVLYFASLHAPDSGALRESQFDSETWVHQGVTFLGVPFVLTMFLTDLRGRLGGGRAAAAQAQPGETSSLA